MTLQVLGITPAPGEITRETPIQFDIRTEDVNSFVDVIVAIEWPGTNVTELAYARNPESPLVDAFEPFYQVASNVESVFDSGWTRFRFTLMRRANGGNALWPDSPQLRVYAYNSAGDVLGIVP